LKLEKCLIDFISQLKDANIESYVGDAEIIISYVLNLEPYELHVKKNLEIADKDIQTIISLIERRKKFEPVAYLTGEKEFYSLPFSVNKDVLVPRPETELLVDLSIYYAPLQGNVLEIGTGSGAISIALKYNRKDLTIIATDISERAIDVAKKNCQNVLDDNSINFLHSNLFEKIDGEFNLIVSNPPYVNPKLKEQLQPDLSYEPESALFANNDGFEIIEKIIANGKNFLKKDGVLLLEIGEEMKKGIETIAFQNDFRVSFLNDYSGLTRVAVLKV